MRVEYVTDIGAVRKANEDFCDGGQLSESSVWMLVCDGMGGANGGNVASSVAAETVKQVLTSGFSEDISDGALKALMINALRRANDAVFEAAEKDDALKGMGTTAVLAVVLNNALHVVHVGDSRCYHLNDKGLHQVTVDHSYVQNLVSFGQISKEEARVHPMRNIITRVLGVHSEVQPDYEVEGFAQGDIVILCSDGLSSYYDDELLEKYVKKYGEDPKELAHQLVKYAKDSGGSDNITVAVIK